MELDGNVNVVVDESGEVIEDNGKILIQDEDGNYKYITLTESLREGLGLQVKSKNKGTIEETTTAVNNGSDVGKLWNHETTLALISLVKENQKEFDTKIKKHVWQKIAKELSNMFNISYSPVQVDTKWKGLVKTYKDIMNHNNTSGRDRRSWQYFEVLNEILYNKPEVIPVATCSSSSGLKINSSKKCVQHSVEQESDTEPEPVSSFTKKRKLKDTTSERRHKERLQRIDNLQSSLDRIVGLLEKKMDQSS